MGWKPKAPDMTAQNRLAQTQEQLALENAQIAREQLAYSREQDERWRPMFEELFESARTSQQRADQRSDDQWNRYLETFAPAETRLATQALSFDTPERRNEAAAEAVAGVDMQFGRAREAQARDLGRRGVSISSGRGMTLDMAGRLAQAKAAAGADSAARRQVEVTGMNLVDNVAKLGRGLTGTSLQAQGIGLSAGSAAGGVLSQEQAVRNASLQPVGAFMGSAFQGLGGAAGTYGQVAQMQQQAQRDFGSALGGLGSLAGTLALAPVTGGGSLFGNLLKSDPKLKKDHGTVSPRAALRSLEGKDVHAWTYKPGVEDGGTHIGRMAGKGDVSTPHGKAIDIISELGTHHAAIKALAQDVAALKKGRRSLADVEDVDYREMTA